MTYQKSPTQIAEEVHPSEWESIQHLIDIEGDVRVKVQLEKIMITKFHEDEALNDSL